MTVFRRVSDECSWNCPESLDETYVRILNEIKKPNRAHARRVLQCLVVAIRPLRVVDLAEVLAVDFDDVEGISSLKPDWLWEEQKLALLSACSSLIAIAEAGDSRVVQFFRISCQGTLDLASSRYRNWRSLELSYRFGDYKYKMMLKVCTRGPSAGSIRRQALGDSCAIWGGVVTLTERDGIYS